MSHIELFQEFHSSRESYWRSIILFGKNTASYKFALAQSLLDFAKKGEGTVTLEEMAMPFAEYTCEHLKRAPKQSTGVAGSFLRTCAGFNEGTVSQDQLIGETMKNGFKYVLDAFPMVNGRKVPLDFYEVSGIAKNRKITLTDETFYLLEDDEFIDLTAEVQARWNLVETAWNTDVSTPLLNVHYDEELRMFFDREANRRRDITSARAALNGYQKGQCFYCYDTISLDPDDEEHFCDVDHFFPHALSQALPDLNLDGVWNLVLSCKDCNRGQHGKFAQIPDQSYLERLNRRNEFLIESHHPLRETLITQTGISTDARKLFLQSVDNRAIELFIHRWKTEPKAPSTF